LFVYIWLEEYLSREESLLTHEPGDAVASAGTTQSTSDSWAAVGLVTACKFLSDPFTQASALDFARPWLAAPLVPVVIAATRDQKRLTQPGHLVLSAHLVDSGIPLGGTSERMPRDFFKTSRCSKSLAFSERKRRISASSSAMLRLSLDSFWKCPVHVPSVPSGRAAGRESPAALRPLLRHNCSASFL
jgi:hypothetical protein